MSSSKRILIVGGVAGGASCAARARRLSEEAEIVMFERGPFVSFANCGLPYYVGNVIKEERDLVLASPMLFRKRFRIDVRLNSEVTAIDREQRQVEVRSLADGQLYREAYDALVLSPGAAPIRLKVPGIDLPGIFTLRTIPDSRLIRRWIKEREARRAVIVGGGYIGLEMAENLAARGLAVTIVEMQPQVMPILDPEMVAMLHDELRRNQVRLLLNETAAGFESNGNGVSAVRLQSGTTVETDLVIVAVGVRPESGLAAEAGLELGRTGGIRVNDRMQTSDPDIWAVGDAVEIRDFVTDLPALIPLAGPANRQGRIAADVILGRDARFRGVQGTAVCGVFELTIAATGPSEKTLKRLGVWDASGGLEKIYLHPEHIASYYPGASPITIKLVFSRRDGRIISAQAVGKEGVEKRIDVVSMAIQMGATVFDLEEAELCYSPLYGAARDPVNVAGMVAANVLRGDARIVHANELNGADALILDVRERNEFREGHIEGAVNIPLGELRDKLQELPREREIWTYCLVGQRSYFAARTLVQHGFQAKNLSGGYKSFRLAGQVTADGS